MLPGSDEELSKSKCVDGNRLWYLRASFCLCFVGLAMREIFGLFI